MIQVGSRTSISPVVSAQKRGIEGWISCWDRCLQAESRTLNGSGFSMNMPAYKTAANVDGKPLRVGFVTPEYPGVYRAYGGLGTFVRQIATTLLQMGHSAVVIVPTDQPESQLSAGLVPVYTLNVQSDLPFPLGRGPSALLAQRIVRLAVELNLDVIEVPEFGGLGGLLDLFKPAKLAIVTRLHTCSAIIRMINNDYPHSARVRLATRILDWLERRSITSADTVIAASRAIESRTRDNLRLPKSLVVHTIPNCADSLFFEASSDRLPAEDPILLSVGMLEWRKGQDLLLRAFPAILRQNAQASIYFVGTDSMTAPHGRSMLRYLKALIPEKASSKVVFCGEMDHQRLSEMYRRATICVFPSRWEACSIACLEAMACGKAIVASGGVFMHEIIRHGVTGILVEGETPEVYASAVNQLLANPIRVSQLGLEARKEASNRFTTVATASATISIYRKTIARKGTNPAAKVLG